MYQSESPNVAIGWTERGFWQRAWRSVSPNVWFLGTTSLLTDVSSEMVASILPVYLVLHLNLSPLAFGTLDGLYNGVTALTRWAGGVAGDRWRRHKEVAALGYAISATCKIGLLAAGRAAPALAAAIAADRIGKGIRTVPRDALISLSAPPNRLGQAFGVHRAMDAAGAMLGPLVALALLAIVPGGFDVVFVTSFCVAIVGLGVLLLFVENVPAARPGAVPAPRPAIRAGFALLRRREFRLLAIVASALALLTISDAFVYLVLQQRVQLPAGLFPLFYVGTASCYLVLAIPAGRLADRIGRPRVFLLGHAALLLVYGLLLLPGAHPGYMFAAVALLGTYYAATDGVIVAVASGLVPADLRGSGLAVLTTATSLARLAASFVFGWLWTMWDRQAAIACFALAFAGALALAIAVLHRPQWNRHE